MQNRHTNNLLIKKNKKILFFIFFILLYSFVFLSDITYHTHYIAHHGQHVVHSNPLASRCCKRCHTVFASGSILTLLCSSYCSGES